MEISTTIAYCARCNAYRHHEHLVMPEGAQYLKCLSGRDSDSAAETDNETATATGQENPVYCGHEINLDGSCRGHVECPVDPARRGENTTPQIEAEMTNLTKGPIWPKVLMVLILLGAVAALGYYLLHGN